MKLTDREEAVIKVMLHAKHGVTASELSSALNVSSKTVYRTVNAINEKYCHHDLIKAKIGIGFELDYDNYLEDSQLATTNRLAVGPKERREKMLLQLVLKSPYPTTVDALLTGSYISQTVLAGDMKLMTQELTHYDLRLVKKSSTLYVGGSEVNLRRLASAIIHHQFTETGSMTSFEPIQPMDEAFIKSIITFIEGEMAGLICHPYNHNMYIHLYIMIARVRKGVLYPDKERVDINQSETALIQANHQVYVIAQKMIQKVSNYLNTTLLDIEVLYAFQLLISSRIENDRLLIHITQDNGVAITTYLIKEMSLISGFELYHQDNLSELLIHIKQMLFRIKHGIVVSNAMLSDIKRQYADLFSALTDTVTKTIDLFHLSSISEDEIGFMLVYFIKYIELSKSHKRKVLIVCHNGVGTSSFLKAKVNKVFPDLEVLDIISKRYLDHHQKAYANIDLIITTSKIKENYDTPMILVSSILTPQDEERIRNYLGELD